MNENKDIFWALKGGGPNFGIVTHYDVYTKPTSEIWFQANVYAVDQAFSILEVFAEWQLDPIPDLKSNVGIVLGIDSIAIFFFYSAPTQQPKAFAPFSAIEPLRVVFPPTNGTFGLAASLVNSISSGIPAR
jgi:hypothetical protein